MGLPFTVISPYTLGIFCFFFLNLQTSAGSGKLPSQLVTSVMSDGFQKETDSSNLFTFL